MAKKREGFWQIELEIEVDGKQVGIDELTEETRKDIVEKILDGYTGGEIQEEIEEE